MNACNQKRYAASYQTEPKQKPWQSSWRELKKRRGQGDHSRQLSAKRLILEGVENHVSPMAMGDYEVRDTWEILEERLEMVLQAFGGPQPSCVGITTGPTERTDQGCSMQLFPIQKSLAKFRRRLHPRRVSSPGAVHQGDHVVWTCLSNRDGVLAATIFAAIPPRQERQEPHEWYCGAHIIISF